ncbi:trypco2 family protein [Streptomyces sp. NPDC020801]|uniref:trypco2 family protein n=1 Tax=unclassified Streptomyces TaxID=2593676 RepID=UPI0037A41D24
MSGTPQWAELGETISAIRAQLQQAQDEARGSDELLFRTGPVELEFSVEVRKDGEAKAKILVLPWSGEARGALAAGTIHRLKLTLQPVDRYDQEAKIHGSR